MSKKKYLGLTLIGFLILLFMGELGYGFLFLIVMGIAPKALPFSIRKLRELRNEWKTTEFDSSSAKKMGGRIIGGMIVLLMGLGLIGFSATLNTAKDNNDLTLVMGNLITVGAASQLFATMFFIFGAIMSLAGIGIMISKPKPKPKTTPLNQRIEEDTTTTES